MQKVAVKFFNKDKKPIVILADYGITIKEAAEKNEIFLAAHCGGVGVCGACRVKIMQGKVSDITQTEKQFLTETELKNGFRLACKTKILDNLVVENTSIENSLKILDDILPFEVNCNEKNGLGVAIDLGTTSVVVAIFDIKNGKYIGSDSFANPQAPFGSDVMSRIFSVSSNPDDLKKMQSLVFCAINQSINKILLENNKTTNDVSKIVVSGNTVMQHIFVGESPVSMGSSPYKSSFLYHTPVKASHFALPFEKAEMCFVPNISAFVGGDITSGLVALDLDKNKNATALFIDLGTNNEMTLLANGQFFATSTAAGPAFEGAGISHGMRAVEGAICSVNIEDNNFVTHTIGKQEAIGICGSGMIDSLAVFLENKIMEKSGKLNQNVPYVGKNEDGVLQVALNASKTVCITQKDIRVLQLVIGSIKAGIKILLQKANINAQSLDKIYLAGAFGNFINIKNARFIGLLPDCKAEVISVKNTSLLGAIRAIFEEDFLQRCLELSQGVTTINLAEEDEFQTIFMNSLDF